MKYVKCGLCIGLSIGVYVLYKTYENEINHACKKMMKMEKNLIKNGLDLD